MSMVKLNKPVHQLTKDECLSILKYHVDAFGCTAAEYYSIADSEILKSIIDRLNEITEEIKPRILYVLTKKVPTYDYLSQIIPPDVSHLGVDDYTVDTTGDRFYPELDIHDIAELIDSYAVLIGNNFIELFINDGNNKDYRNTVSNALKGLKEFYCTKIILYP